MCLGVGPSGLPIDRSMMSSPRRRAAMFSSLVMLKTYDGSRLILENSRIVEFERETSRCRPEPRQHHHRLRRGPRAGERQAPRLERRRSVRPGPAVGSKKFLNSAGGRFFLAHKPWSRNRPARHRSSPALSASAAHGATRGGGHRRRGDGPQGRLPHLQHPGRRGAQGRRRAAVRVTVRVLLAALAIAWFGTLGLRPLYKADESRYAEIPREMVASGDWITPRLNGFKYFEKPPLQYWATAAFFSLLGEKDWVARLWTALIGFAGIAMVLVTANRLFGAPLGLYAAAVLAGSALFLLITAPWFIAVSAANAEFAHFFFVQEHFQRFTTQMHQRVHPGWYFIPVLIAGMAPWLVPLGHAAVRAFGQRTDAELLLWIWALVVFVFFSASGSKLPPYILPIFPALAVLVVTSLTRRVLIAQSLVTIPVALGAGLAVHRLAAV